MGARPDALPAPHAAPRPHRSLTKTVLLGLAGLLLCAVGIARAQAPAPCDTCQDLCRLMDQYQQRTKAIEIWRQYTGHGGKKIPQGVTTGSQMEDLFKQQFDAWLATRRPAPNAPPDDLGSLPCRLKPSVGGRGGGGGATSDLHTNLASCKILTSAGQELVGPVRDAFEASVNCKAETDAVIAHEEVHQMHCRNAHKMDPAGAEDFLSTPWMTAESELDAYTKHRDEIGKAIRAIVNKWGCGWQPTHRQQTDPQSIPSLKQVQDMSKRAWQAAAALSDGGVTP